MRVLLLRRQQLGGIASLTNILAQTLKRRGVDAVVEDASEWIPNQTDLASSRPATKQLREIAKNYDVVHAFGYRSAWACSDAFGAREGWLYTGYDQPKTTHRLLIDKLNDAQAGVCSSYVVRDSLSEAGAGNLIVRTPAALIAGSLLSEGDAKSMFGVAADVPLVAAIGRLVPERGFAALIEQMEQVWVQVRQAHLAIAGDGPLLPELREKAKQTSRPHQVRIVGHIKNPADLFRAADLLAVPSTRAGFSMAAAEAMLSGTPVLVRETCLREMVERDATGLLFTDERELGLRIAEALQTPMRLEAISNAARIRAETLFSPDRYAEAMEKKYREVLD